MHGKWSVQMYLVERMSTFGVVSSLSYHSIMDCFHAIAVYYLSTLGYHGITESQQCFPGKIKRRFADSQAPSLLLQLLIKHDVFVKSTPWLMYAVGLP
jgi:hypothetical protein